MARQVDLLEDVSVAERVTDLEFTVGQVCRVAGITKMQLDYWTQRGDIPAGRIGRCVRYDPRDLAAWIEKHKNKPSVTTSTNETASARSP